MNLRQDWCATLLRVRWLKYLLHVAWQTGSILM